ncbi:MAG: heavy metal translocating P-type ATPase [Cuniculiplasma sp.]
MPTDPVCGMFVSEDSDLFSDVDGKRYYFCSKSCKDKFSSPEKEARRLRNKLIVGWVFSIPVIVITYVIFPFPMKDYLLLFLAIPVQFYSGFDFYIGAYQSIRSRSGNMDLLIAMGTATAFSFSLIVTVFPQLITGSSVFYDASTFIITLILTGSYIESRTKLRANSSAQKLLGMIPNVSHVLINEQIVDVKTNEVKPGDLILLKPGEIVPLDGVVRYGKSEVDQSMLTGEQEPIFVEVNSSVFSGTRNLNGAITLEVTKSGKDSTVNQIYDLIQSAISGRARVQKVADAFSSIFVPIVISAAVISGLFWYLYLSSLSYALSSEIAILAFVSVVVVACPCAIGLAGPISLLISSNFASENGIIIKNTSSLDRVSRGTLALFDKTGTLTESDPTILSTQIDNKEIGESGLFSIAASLETYSNHPIGKAICKFAEEKGYDLMKADNFRENPGTGTEGEIQGIKYSVARSKTGEGEGSCVSVVRGGNEIGRITLSYRIRPNAFSAIEKLKLLGFRVGMVTGDSRSEGERVGNKLGIDFIHCEMLPDQKADIIKQYQEKGEFVLFTGDGINDSVALETADAGIAMSGGSDIAKDSGDIIILNDNLENVASAVIIGRDTISKVKQNIGWAIGYNSILIPIAAGILVPFFGFSIYSFLPILAALAMGMSSTSVVLNSLLLRGKIRRHMSVFSKQVMNQTSGNVAPEFTLTETGK